VYLAAGSDVRLFSVKAPSAELMSRSSDDRKPGDDNKLRRASATFRLTDIEQEGVSKPAFPPHGVGSKSEPDGEAALAKPAAKAVDTTSKLAPVDAVTAAKARSTKSITPPVMPPDEGDTPSPMGHVSCPPSTFGEQISAWWGRMTDRNALRNL